MKALKTIGVHVLMICSVASSAGALDLKTVKEKAQCAFFAVAEKMRMLEVAVSDGPPTVVYSGESSVDEFNRENEGFINMKLEVFMNIYIAKTNKVFLSTDPKRYKAPRTALDSLAHEFTHYFQFVSVDRDLTSPILYSDESESEAIRVQEWFRETNPCGI